MGRGKRTSDDEGIDKTKAGLALALVFVVSAATYPVWSQYVPNVPFGPGDGEFEGLKLTGTVEFANHTAVSGTSYTCSFVDPETHSTKYTGTISGGSFTTNKGPEDGGLFKQYINIAGCHIFVQDVDIPKAKDWDNEFYTIEETAILWPATSLTGSNWNVLVTSGSVANSFTGGGSAASSNYTATAGTAQNFDFKIENQLDYSKLFREYVDPYDAGSEYDAYEQTTDIPIQPVLYLEIGTETNVYQQDAYPHWSAGSATTFLIPLSEITCPGSANINKHWDIDLVFQAGTYTVKAWIVDGSHPDYVETAKNRVADPLSGETVTAINILDCYITAS